VLISSTQQFVFQNCSLFLEGRWVRCLSVCPLTVFSHFV
jgi:hypothetical protein